VPPVIGGYVTTLKLMGSANGGNLRLSGFFSASDGFFSHHFWPTNFLML
jgi:hypothetical protein